jgi:Baseplate J-like protein
MVVRVASLSELSSDTVQANQAFMTALLNARYPELDTTRGVVHDVICFLAGGVVSSVTKTELDRAYASRSLLAVRSDPTKFDADVIDHILSNFLVSRNTAAAAVGTLTVVISDNITTVVPSGGIWTIGTTSFQTQFPVVARVVGGSLVSSNDRPLISRGDGTYEFSLPVLAIDKGTAGNIRANTSATPSFSLPKFVKAVTREDFTGGKDEETITSALTRLANGIPAKVAAGGENIKSMLRAQSGYTDAEFSVVGFGNQAQLRDKRSIFPVSFGGGRVDVYARTASNMITVTRTKSATLLEIVDDRTSLWQLNVSKTDFPGHYLATTIQNPRNLSGGDIPISSISRSYDRVAATAVHDIQRDSEAFLTMYQTAGIKFLDTTTVATTLTLGQTSDYTVTLTGQPGIDLLQSIVDSAEHRSWSADVLIKAAVPADVQIDIQIAASNITLSTADIAAVKVAAAKAATLSGFPGKLYVATIIQAASAALPSGAQIAALNAYARVLQNNGAWLTVSDKDVLTVPFLPDVGVTADTVGFFCHVSNITVTQN